MGDQSRDRAPRYGARGGALARFGTGKNESDGSVPGPCCSPLRARGSERYKGDRLFWITAEAPLLMRITLPEKLIGRIRRGQQFDITSADIQGEKHVARVREVSPVIDPASGTFEVLFELIGDHGALRPGMTADLHLNGLQ